MINQLQGLAWGVISLAVIIGLGSLVIEKFAGNVADCPTGYSYQTNGTVVYTNGYCCNSTSPDCSTGLDGVSNGNTINETNFSSSNSVATTNLEYMGTQLGSTGGGLATWVPIIIVLVVAVFFLSYFLGNNFGRKV